MHYSNVMLSISPLCHSYRVVVMEMIYSTLFKCFKCLISFTLSLSLFSIQLLKSTERFADVVNDNSAVTCASVWQQSTKPNFLTRIDTQLIVLLQVIFRAELRHFLLLLLLLYPLIHFV